MTIKKHPVDHEKLRDKLRVALSKMGSLDALSNTGVGNTPNPNTPNALPIRAKNEVAYGNEETGAVIVCGADRPRGVFSGKGGEGRQQSGAIRLTAGPLGSFADTQDGDKQLYREPDNKNDAATIYLSALSDVDDDFNLANGSTGNMKNRSCAVVKADAVRHISRDGGIQLIAGTGEKNARGAPAIGVPTIDFICNNDDSALQPIPKGKNLVRCLIRMEEMIEDLTNIVGGFLSSQMAFNAVLTNHTHPTLPSPVVAPVPVPGTPIGATTVGSTTMSPECVAAGAVCSGLQGGLTEPSITIMATYNLPLFKVNYLTNKSSGKYINSRNVNVT